MEVRAQVGIGLYSLNLGVVKIKGTFVSKDS